MPETTTSKTKRASAKPRGGRSSATEGTTPNRKCSSFSRPESHSRRGTLPSTVGASSPNDGPLGVLHTPGRPSRGSLGQSARPRASFAATQPTGKSRLVPAPPRANAEVSISLFAATTDPSRLRMSVFGGTENSAAAASHHHMTPTSYSSQVRPPGSRALGDRRSTTTRVVRGVSQIVAVTRLQRAARRFLLHRALQHIPVSFSGDVPHSLGEASTTPLHLRTSGHVEEKEQRRRRNLVLVLDVPATASSAAMESRMVHRIRAELHRNERLKTLRATIAKRTLETALREWVRRSCARRHSPLRSGGAGAFGARTQQQQQLTLWAAQGGEVVRVDGAACTVQAVLRARRSGVAVADLGTQRRRRNAALAILRAWRRSPLHTAYITRLHDRQVREVVLRQEAVERREVLRRHLQFLVRCHQQLYNHPGMWEAGLALRRLPLYAPEGLYLAGATGTSFSTTGEGGGGGGLLPISAASETRGGGEGGWSGSPPASFPGLLRPAASTAASNTTMAAGAVKGEEGQMEEQMGCSDDDAFLDVDLELRRCQYRLFFSPEDRRVWEEEEEEADEKENGAAVFPSSDSAAEMKPSAAPSTSGSRGDTSVVPASQRTPIPASEGEEDAPTYARTFASALTFLRESRVVDPQVQPVLRQLADLRSDPALLQRVLSTHGHLPAEVVAPLACYGRHLQRVARGEEDHGVLTSTAAMRIYQPLVVGVTANPAAELRCCLVGASVRGSGGCGMGVDGRLPLPLEESRCRQEAALRHHSGVCHYCDDAEAALFPLAPAGLQRSGFASPATQALFDTTAGAASSSSSPPPPPQPPSAGEAGGQQPAEWDHRLATGVGEVGVAWRHFLLSIPPPGSSAAFSSRVAVPQPSSAKKDVAARSNVVRWSPAAAASPPSQGRRFVGISTYLAPSPSLTNFSCCPAPTLLRSFEPAPSSTCFSSPPEAERETMLPACAPSPPPPASVQSRATRGPRASSTVLHSGDWWDAVERLLIQERVRRGAAEHNEAEQRRSIHLLRRMAPAAVAAPVTASA